MMEIALWGNDGHADGKYPSIGLSKHHRNSCRNAHRLLSHLLLKRHPNTPQLDHEDPSIFVHHQPFSVDFCLPIILIFRKSRGEDSQTSVGSFSAPVEQAFASFQR
jgi:hypothetical protein